VKIILEQKRIWVIGNNVNLKGNKVIKVEGEINITLGT